MELKNKNRVPIQILIAGAFWGMFLVFGCTDAPAGDGGKENTQHPSAMEVSEKKYAFPYYLDEPDEKVKLPSVLKEISGLAWIDDDLLATVQDEKGNIYIFDFDKGEVVREIDFGGNGDYEGVAKRGDDFWVVRSDGRLYEARGDGSVEVYDTALDEDFDVEGLEWYEKEQVFLLACKAYPGQGKALKGKKTCYAFDPETEQLNLQPRFIIDLQAIANGKKANPKDRISEFFEPGKGSKVFQPSGIAVHPISGDIYLISSVGKKLVILSPKGKLLYVTTLDYGHFKQPEGICFSPEGVLYISTEGAGGKGKIMRFDP